MIWQIQSFKPRCVLAPYVIADADVRKLCQHPSHSASVGFSCEGSFGVTGPLGIETAMLPLSD